MYQEDDGEYPAYEEGEEKPRRKLKLFSGVALLIYAVIGGALAQTITLNGNGTVEFGQGVLTLKACDSFISMTLDPTESTYSGKRANGEDYTNLSRVLSVTLTGLDTKSCAGKKIKLQVFNNETTTAMSLFTDAASLAVDRILLDINSDITVSRGAAVTLIDGVGRNIGYFNSYQYISYAANRAEYTIFLANPLALMSDVTRVGVESTDA